MVSKREAMNLNRGDSLLMPRKTFRLPLSVISLLLLGQAGCAAKKTITSTYPPFRLQVVDNASLLLTPSVPKDSPNDAPILVKGIAKTRSNAPADTCTLEQGPFRLEPDLAEKNTLMITLPPREEWLARLEGQSDADDRTVFDLLDTFLTKLDQLRSSGCLEESVDALRGSILQSIPTKPEQGLLNAYDYRGGRSSIDLNEINGGSFLDRRKTGKIETRTRRILVFRIIYKPKLIAHLDTSSCQAHAVSRSVRRQGYEDFRTRLRGFRPYARRVQLMSVFRRKSP